jgi:hypothetical protein
VLAERRKGAFTVMKCGGLNGIAVSQEVDQHDNDQSL